HWILVDAPEGNGIRAALNPADLSAFLQERGAEEEVIDLLELPGQRMDVATVDDTATANEVASALSKSGAGVCCVTRTTAPMIKPVIGIVTQSHLDNYRNLSS
ncbi:MAG: CIC family chloride channel protein, partial [Candidatus Azotimanducaceae bacterium]